MSLQRPAAILNSAPAAQYSLPMIVPAQAELLVSVMTAVGTAPNSKVHLQEVSCLIFFVTISSQRAFQQSQHPELLWHCSCAHQATRIHTQQDSSAHEQPEKQNCGSLEASPEGVSPGPLDGGRSAAASADAAADWADTCSAGMAPSDSCTSTSQGDMVISISSEKWWQRTNAREDTQPKHCAIMLVLAGRSLEPLHGEMITYTCPYCFAGHYLSSQACLLQPAPAQKQVYKSLRRCCPEIVSKEGVQSQRIKTYLLSRGLLGGRLVETAWRAP